MWLSPKAPMDANAGINGNPFIYRGHYKSAQCKTTSKEKRYISTNFSHTLGFEEGAQEVVDPYVRLHVLGDPKDEKTLKTSVVSILIMLFDAP